MNSKDELSFAIVFDHFVPSSDVDPEVLQLNIIDSQDQAQLQKYFKSIIIDRHDPKYFDSIIAVPRCCQTRVGSTDRGRVNDEVNDQKERNKNNALVLRNRGLDEEAVARLIRERAGPVMEIRGLT
ncbi:hypothetical protein MMC24_007197 [Lignoscripta atroalba]|nr:hypothetical protein [Lignoscripta atroalba]